LALPAAALAAAGLLVAAGGVAEAAPGSARTTRPAVACVSERADARSATAVAKACGRRVEVLERRSEVRSEFANPDGTTTLQQWTAPTRVRRPGGGWAPVDTTLRRDGDGSVAPLAAANGLRLSGGGSGPLATVRTEHGPVSLTWPTALPAPRLDGAAAVYAGVLPGVDLRVQALRDGFTYVFVVHTREAASNPALRELRLGLSTAGGSVRKTADGYRLVNADGAALGTMGGASMWDSRGKSTPDSASPTARTATPGVQVTDRELVLRPDLDLLHDPGAEFPLYIDPPFYSPWNIWAYANSANNSRPMDVARVGNNPDGSGIYRTFWQFPAWDMHGATVIQASFFAKMVHSWTCAASAINLYSVNGTISHGKVAWSPGLVGGPLSERWGNAHKGPDACGYQPDVILEFSDWFTSLVQIRANEAGWIRVALSAQRWNFSNNTPYGESDVTLWKKFDPASVYMTATFNRTPGPPVPGPISDCYQSCGSPAVTRSLTPELTSTVSDPDGGTLRTEFEVWNAASTTLVQSSGTTVTGVPSGSVARWRLPAALAADTAYTWRSRACDDRVCGAWTAWLQLRTDATNPAVPGVSSPLYKEDTTGTVNGGIGVPGQFTFTANGSADVTEYAWSLDGTTPVTVAAPAPGASVTVTLTPVRDLVAVLQVTARDAAGRVSSPRTYRFRVTPPPSEAAGWRLNESTGTVADDHIDGRPARLNGSVAWGAPGRATGDTAARFTNVGWFQTDLPVVSTASSFSVAAWARLTDTTGYRVLASQDGAAFSMFQLQYRPIENKLCFAVRSSDSAAGSETFACASGPVPVNSWMHLAGVYNAQAGTITFYVNGGDPDRGGSVTTTAFTAAWAATGPFAIGRNRYNSSPGGWWIGDIDEVLAFQRALPLEEVQFLSFT
jgi:hypothetical protein